MRSQNSTIKRAIYARIGKIIFAVFITAVLVVILLSLISVDDFITSLSKLSVRFMLLSTLFYVFSYIFRASRFKLLLSDGIGLKRLFSIVCIHNFMNYLLPARLGELSYLHMIREQKIPLGKNVASFAIARIFDVICVSLIFLLGALMISDAPEFVITAIIAIGILLSLLVIFLLCLLFIHERVNKKIDALKKKTKMKFAKKVMDKTKEIIHGFQVLKERHVAGKTFIFSMLIWFSLYFSIYLLLLDLGLYLDVGQILIATTFPVIVSILPIHGVGGYGTAEVAWLIPLLAFGIVRETAVSSGFIIHTFQFLLVIIFGFFGYMAYRNRTKNVS